MAFVMTAYRRRFVRFAAFAAIASFTLFALAATAKLPAAEPRPPVAPAAAPAVAPPAAAEPNATKQYIVETPDPNTKAATAAKSELGRLLRMPRLSPADLATFDTNYKTYFEKSHFPLWTQPERKKDVAATRPFIRSMFVQAAPGDAHDHLSDLILEKMKAFAAGNYHPVVRYNAILMIGELNAKEAPMGSLTELPVPLPKAVPVLLAAVENPQLIDAVRVGGLVGLKRHAQFGGIPDEAERKKVMAAMLRILDATELPGDRSYAGDAWMRALAAETLAYLAFPNSNARVAKSLTALISNSDVPFNTRCAAARALGRLSEKGGAFDASPTIRGLAQMTLDACAAVDQTAASESYPDRRRRLKERIKAVAAALGIDEPAAGETARRQLATAVTDPAVKALGSELAAAVKKLSEAMDDKKLSASEETFSIEVVNAMDKVQKAMK
jgi:hypothetical protein